MELLDQRAFAAKLSDEWRQRYGGEFDCEKHSLPLEALYALYGSYRKRVLARLRDDDTSAAVNVQRFSEYRDRVGEIFDGAATLRDAVRFLEWIEKLRIPYEIPWKISATGTKMHMIEPSSIPHTLRPVRWHSPFGPDTSALSVLLGDADAPTWMDEWASMREILMNIAAVAEHTASEIERQTINQQDAADRRSFRKAFAAVVESANPGKDTKAYGLGAILFSFIWGTDTSEESYRKMCYRDPKDA